MIRHTRVCPESHIPIQVVCERDYDEVIISDDSNYGYTSDSNYSKSVRMNKHKISYR